MTLTEPRTQESSTPPSSPRPRRKFQARRPVMIITVVLIGYLVITPLGFLLYRTFVEDGSLGFAGFARAYSAPNAGSMVRNTILFSVGAGALAVTVGTALAYVNVRTDAPLKRLFFAASLVPLVIPGILYAPAWIFLASPDIGLFNTMSREVFGGPIIDIYSLPGMILVEGLHLSPVAFLLMVPAFRSMDPSLEESARISRASRWAVLRRITLPLVRPALISAALLVTIQALESFEVPAIIGFSAGIYTFTTRIYFELQLFPIDYAAAGALALGLLVIAVLGILLIRYLSKDLARFGTVTGKAFRPRVIPLGRARWVVGGLVLLYFAIAVVAPLGILAYSSLLPFYQVPSAEAFRLFSFDNYARLFELPSATRAFRNSFVLALSAATAVMCLTSVAAWIVVRTRLRFRFVLDNLAFAPLIIPGLVLGLALLFVYIRSPLPIYGSLLILFIAYVTRMLPYGMRYSAASMQQVAVELEESARVSGASWWQSFRRILLPLTSAGFVAGWAYVFLISFRELTASVLLYSPGNEVVSILVFTQYQEGNLTLLSALGVVMISILLSVVMIAYAVGARIGLQEQS